MSANNRPPSTVAAAAAASSIRTRQRSKRAASSAFEDDEEQRRLAMDTIRRRFRNSPPKSIHKSPTPRRPYPRRPSVTTRDGGPVPISLSFKNDESSSVDDVPLIQLKTGLVGDDDGNRRIDLVMFVELDQRAAMAREEYER